MDIRQLADSTAPTVTAAEAASVLGISPQALRIAARDNPSLLGGCCACIGSRVLVSRLGLLAWLGYSPHPPIPKTPKQPTAKQVTRSAYIITHFYRYVKKNGVIVQEALRAEARILA